MFPRTLVVILLFFLVSANSEELNCKGRPEIVEPCYATRGRLQVTNGTPFVRMWKVGTERIIGVASGLEEELMMPIMLKEKIDIETYVFGDYVVCPFTKEKPGWMQIVCIESANNIRVENIR